MNREVLQNILLVVFGLALILVGVVVFMQSQEISNVSSRIDTMSQSMMESSDKLDSAMMKMEEMDEKMEGQAMMMEEQAMMEENTKNSASVVNWDLAFDYPEGWYVTLYDDAFTGGQQNLRLTSSRGILFISESSGGPGRSGVNYFNEGFQANMFKLAEAQDPFTESEPTSYENIVKDIGLCEAGCPTERYIFTGIDGRYEIDFYYTDDSYEEYVDTILSSLSNVGN